MSLNNLSKIYMRQNNIISAAVFIILLALAGNNLQAQKLSMKDAVKTAIENNSEIKAAKLNIQKEDAVKLRSFNIPRPELFLEYEGIKGSLKNYESRKIGILQEFEFPTSYFFRSDVQSSQVEIAKAELDLVSKKIKFEVENAYLQLLLDKKLLEIAIDNLKIYTDFLFVASKKFEAGSTSNLEVLGARVNKIKFENEVKNLQSQILASESVLKKLLNTGNIEIQPVDELIFKEIIITKEGLLKAALINNPEVKINRYKKEKYSNKVSLTKSELLPNLSFKYYTQKIGDDGGFWGVEFGLGLPLWFWWENSGSIKEADYELKITSVEETNIRSSIENILNLAYEEYVNGLRQVIFFSGEAVPEADEILRQSRISYNEGAIDYVEYLQALQIVYETRVQNLNAVFSYNQSIIKLENISAGELK